MSMFIVTIQGKSVFRMCPSRIHRHNLTSPDDAIPHYSSFSEAMNHGWERTTNPDFCPPDEGYVWICPECAKMKKETTQ